MKKTTTLFSDTTGKLQLKNRIVMAPMTRSRALGNIPNDLMATYYSQRSSAGLLITEGNAPNADGLGYARIPGIFLPDQVKGWKLVTDAVHANGGKIFTQIMHTGRIGHSANLPAGGKLLAPSAISASAPMWTDTLGMQTTELPTEMTPANINEVIEVFVQAAENAIEAGFDGVELHAANGYLLEQFLNPNSNIREDQYGSTVQNRIRFVLELTKAVVDRIGADRVGVRISPYNTFNTMPVYAEIPETYRLLVEGLQSIGVVYLHVIDYAMLGSEDGRDLLASIRQSFTGYIIRNGGYTRDRANLVLGSAEADLVSFGSPFIANPDLPHRLEHDLELASPDASSFYTPGAEGYIDYTAADNHFSNKQMNNHENERAFTL